jgi:Tfp pilus assembly protein PilX
MSTGIIVVIVVAVIVVAALVTGGMAIMRRRRLQQRFGPEYDRVAGARDSKLKADSELAERERRVRALTRLSGQMSRSGSSTRQRTLWQARSCLLPP